MSRYGDTASPTTGSSAGGAGGRWDTARFMRERDERHESPRRERRTVEVLERERSGRRGPSFIEEYIKSQERYGAPGRRSDKVYMDETLTPTSQAIVPVREPSPSPARKPRLLRRQSSLDSFDRAATRLAGHHYDRDDYGPPVSHLALRKASPVSDSDFESIRVSEPDFYGDEEFRRMRDRDRSATPRGRRYSSLRTEVVKERAERPYPRRGKTRVPKRLITARALVELGYEFDEKDDTYIIFQALGKENIDELIDFSRELTRKTRVEEIREKEKLVTRTRRESVSVSRTRSQSRRRSSSVIRPRPEFVEIKPPEIKPADVFKPIEVRPEKPDVIEVSKSEYLELVGKNTRRVSPSPARSPARPTAAIPVVVPRAFRQRRLSSPVRMVQPRDNEIILPNTDVSRILPERRRRTDREIQAEIQALESERKQLALAGAQPLQVAPGDVVEVQRNYKAPSARLLRAMMATLT